MDLTLGRFGKALTGSDVVGRGRRRGGMMNVYVDLVALRELPRFQLITEVM